MSQELSIVMAPFENHCDVSFLQTGSSNGFEWGGCVIVVFNFQFGAAVVKQPNSPVVIREHRRPELKAGANA
jgi:hypothetical protein